MPHPIFLTNSAKSLKTLNFSPKSHFNLLRIENSGLPDQSTGFMALILA